MRVVIAEDEALLREGLARVRQDAVFEVAGRCGDAEALLRMVEARKPDVAIVDIRMPPGHGDDGLVAAQAIRRHPDVGVLVFSHYLDLAAQDQPGWVRLPSGRGHRGSILSR